MKVLVTGGCGYIGSHTIVDLVQNGYDVISVDNLSNSFANCLIGIEKITGRGIKNYAIDLCDEEALRQVFVQEKNISGVIHFAAKKYVNESVEQPLIYYKNNLGGLQNILACCLDFNVKHFVFSSSCSVYGNAQNLPVNETAPLAEAESPYAQTKVIGEQIIRDVAKANDLKTSLLRYFNPAGAHDSGYIGEKPKQEGLNIVPRITGTALGKYQDFKIFGSDYPTKDGTCVRDYIHVSDIAHAHTLALNWLFSQVNKPLCEVFNLGSGNGVSVLEMVKAFEKANELRLNYMLEERREGDVVAIYADRTKAKAILNWEPKHSLEEMMKSAWEWDKKIHAV